MTSQWYKKNEQGTRIGIWFAQNAMGNMLGAFLAWGLAKHDRAGEFSIAGWKVLFICLGGLTVVLGIVLLVFLPDSPRTARFLSEPDRALAVERIKGNQTGIGNKTHKWPQVKEALLDPLTWLYCLYSVALSIFNGGVTSFFSIIIASLGYGPLDSLLYGAPGGAVLLVSVITLMHLGDRLRKRLLCGILSLCISSSASSSSGCSRPRSRSAASSATTCRWSRPSASSSSSPSSAPTCPAVPRRRPSRPSSSSSTPSATSSVRLPIPFPLLFLRAVQLTPRHLFPPAGPQTFRAQDAPRYGPALATFAAVIGFGMADLALIWWLNARENRRRDEAARDKGYEQQQEVNADELDLTDRCVPLADLACRVPGTSARSSSHLRGRAAKTRRSAMSAEGG